MRKTGVGGNRLYKVVAGFIALGESDGCVAPVVGWGVREEPLIAVIVGLERRIRGRTPHPDVEPQK